MNKEQVKEYVSSNIFDIGAIIISLISLIISVITYFSDQQSRPLDFYLKPSKSSFNENEIVIEVEVIVTNGAIGDVRFLDYKNNIIVSDKHYRGGMIDENSNKDGRTFVLTFYYDNQIDEFILTQYALIHGKDGSKNLGMILCHVDLSENEIAVDYYSIEDLVLAGLNPTKEIYSNAFSDYHQLYELLKESGEL